MTEWSYHLLARGMAAKEIYPQACSSNPVRRPPWVDGGQNDTDTRPPSRPQPLSMCSRSDIVDVLWWYCSLQLSNQALSVRVTVQATYSDSHLVRRDTKLWLCGMMTYSGALVHPIEDVDTWFKSSLSLLYYLLLLTLTSSLIFIFWTHIMLERGSHFHKSRPFHLWVEYLTVDSTATLVMVSASRTNGHILVLVYGTGRNKRPDSGVCRPL